ncbi:MAG: hypothetical protein U9N79_03375 [Actinomycetota bacterium]|nr:hypothetical protein [Actinomycetota bacterium]
MWVWSDELVERASVRSADRLEGVPLVAYAVASEADVDDLVLEILSGVSAEAANTRSAGRGGGDR